MYTSVAPLLEDAKTGSPPLYHFLHPGHSLRLVHIDADFECDGCNLPGQGLRYRCSECSGKSLFDLHKRCATCPSSLSCGFHPNHTLTLAVDHQKSPGPCALCGDDVLGLYYTCGSRGCSFEIHPLCTELPPEVHHAHHPDQLLVLQQASSAGRCLACRGSCCDRWRYRCGPCGVEAHLECAFGQSPAHAPQVAVVGHPAVGQGGLCCPPPAQLPPPPPPPPPTVLYYQNGRFYVMPGGVTTTYNSYQLQRGQTANSGYADQYYYPPPPQQAMECSSSNSGGITGKRICTLLGIIAIKCAIGATTGMVF